MKAMPAHPRGGACRAPLPAALAPRPRAAPRRCRRAARVTAELADVAALVAFSAAPFLAVQALADSSLGKRLQDDMLSRKAELRRGAAARDAARAAARAALPAFYGPSRPLWLPSARAPPHLNGTQPADYGYDPLGLGRDPERLELYTYHELLHCRWAMLGALGALVPEALQSAGAARFLEPVWFRVAAAKAASGEDLNYLGLGGLHIAGGQGLAVIALCNALLMFGPEYARYCGIEALEPLGIYLPGTRAYPGGAFDPLGLADDAAAAERLRVAELKHGRLALVAWLGFAAQAAATGEGPLANLRAALGGGAG